jgi:prephenate dehydrogenase
MPIDPKQFKKIITNHFKNITEEEFLKTLYKSSPRLFNQKPEQVQDVQLHNKNEVISENTTKLQ